MANRIVGLDIGTWAVKAVAIERGSDVQVVGYREIALGDVGEPGPVFEGADGSVQTDGEEESSEQPVGDSAPDDSEQMFPDVGDDVPPVPGEEPGEQDGGDWSDEGIDAGADEGPSQWGDSQDVGGGAAFDPDAPPWANAVRQLIREGFFEGVNRIITAFPDDEAAVLHLEVPFQRREDVEDVLPHFLMDELPISFDDIIHDFVVIPGKQAGQFEALVGFVKREKMRLFLDDCKATGIDPAVVGVPELMLRYAGQPALEHSIDSYGVIDIGHRFTRLLVMSEGKPVVAHTARRAGAAITDAIAQNFQISEEEARRLKHEEGIVGSAAAGGDRQVRKLAGTIEESLRPVIRDLRRSFQSAYAKYGVAVDEIYICGGTSRLHGLHDYLEGEFDVPVKPLKVEQGVSWHVGAGDREREPEASMALANALQGPLDEDNKTVVDFRQEEFVYRGKSSYLRQQLVRLGAVAAVLLVMIAGVLIMRHYDRHTQLQAMERAVAEQTQELFGDAVTDPQQVQARLQGEGADQRGFVPQMSAYELKVRIIELIDEDTALELDRMEVDTDRGLVQIMAETDSPQAVDRIAADIEQLECLTDVSDEQVNVEGDDEVHFELQITSGCS